MEIGDSVLSQSLQPTFCFLFFSFTLSFTIFSLLLFALSLLKPHCACEICRSYLSRSWSPEFDNLADWYTHLLRKSPTNTIHIHVLNNTITANPENVEHILKTQFENYPKGRLFSAILGDLLGKGIFNVDGDSWKFQRKMASLEMGSVSIRSYAFDIVGSEIQSNLIPLFSSVSWEKDSVLDLQQVFQRFSFDTIFRFSLGLDPNTLQLSLPISDFVMAFDLASKLSAERAMSVSPLIWKVKKVLNLGSEKKLKKSIEVVKSLAQEVIENRRKMGVSTQNDLLSRFMSSINDDAYIIDIVISFLLAGRDTVASALTGFFWLLSQHPEVEKAIREESDRVMGPTKELASLVQMREMHYLQAAMYETMRLHPPVQFDSKFCEDDDILPDHTFVPKGTRITYHPYAMGRMERVWGPDCFDFKPERWLQGGVFCPVSPFKYPVFQAGPRVCLGKEIALLEMKSVALSLVGRFDIRVAMPEKALRFMPGLTATVRGGLPVIIQERKR
ncbi:cytochrome P450 94C1-like [Rhododendron vialii]|uniref:cytochrome P450 94C1-like n=1 Tax=Rhododendron vialii TaxID=182163 RepID=UPI00265E68AA|nr:cytochrome P450 94C1-like [Rhododendron vialii]